VCKWVMCAKKKFGGFIFRDVNCVGRYHNFYDCNHSFRPSPLQIKKEADQIAIGQEN
jgi:hypothetical protein